MLVWVISLLYWTQTEAFSVRGCSATVVSVPGHNVNNTVLSVGEGFKLNCEFTCLRPQHIAQMWRKNSSEDGVPIVNITSTFPNVSLVLNIWSATKEDAGNYFCMTQPPDTISPFITIQIADSLTTIKPMQPTNSSCQPNNAAGVHVGLQGQIWYWMLLGKTAILFLSLALLAAKYKTG